MTAGGSDKFTEEKRGGEKVHLPRKTLPVLDGNGRPGKALTLVATEPECQPGNSARRCGGECAEKVFFSFSACASGEKKGEANEGRKKLGSERLRAIRDK